MVYSLQCVKLEDMSSAKGTVSLSTIAAVVKQAEGDKYVTISLVLPFINTCMKSLVADGSIKQPWFGKGNARSEFPVSSAFGHESIKSARKSVRDDLELKWVTNLSEKRKRFYLIATLLDPRTKLMSFCDNKYFPSSWKDEGHAFLSMEFKCFYMDHTQGEVNDTEVQVPKPSVLDDLLGVSSTSMDVDPSSVNGETERVILLEVQRLQPLCSQMCVPASHRWRR